ncbi:RHS repeat-associated core domain-containing protein [Alteromonas sp. M12]|uniref:RHS repeat protein n=1 Tax=Alteromonas sp. M12 TaxID=3135644 RepID=UPI00319E9A46
MPINLRLYPAGVVHSLVDRLGSPSTLLKGRTSSPVVLRYRAHGIFGKPIDAGTGSILDSLSSWDGQYRGYTGHEQLVEQQLIHMNGRVYDYNLGRFMSVDPFIQMPESSQSINPYSYIMNNPMAGTDPTGYIGESANATTEQYTQTDTQKAEDISDKIFEKLEVDSNGNVFITAEGVEYKVKSIVKAGVTAGAENGTGRGLNSDSGTGGNTDKIGKTNSNRQSSDDYMKVKPNRYVTNAGGELDPAGSQLSEDFNNQESDHPLLDNDEFYKVYNSARQVLNNTADLMRKANPSTEYGIVIYMNNDGTFRHGNANYNVPQGTDGGLSKNISEFVEPPLPIKGNGAAMILISAAPNARRITIEGNAYKYNHLYKVTSNVPVLVYGRRKAFGAAYLATGKDPMKKIG